MAIPRKIKSGISNSHLITQGKFQYQSPATRGFAARAWRLVLEFAFRDLVGILQSLILFFWGFLQSFICGLKITFSPLVYTQHQYLFGHFLLTNIFTFVLGCFAVW